MNIKLLVVAIASAFASSAMAQSAFQGFYGQISTGYESNSFGSGNGAISSPTSNEYYLLNSPSQQFGGAPLIFGVGYNFSIAPNWVLGIGADYSALSQTSSTFSSNIRVAELPGAAANFSGNSIQLSNRFNIFLAPGYLIDENKLVYLKAGYSSVSAKLNSPSSYDVNYNGFDLSVPLNMGSSSSTLSGYVVGLGYKQMITNGFYGFAEANYMSYSNPSFSYSGAVGDLPTTSNLSANLNSYQLLVGVGYKF